jgi:hypothetical protein
MRATYTAHLINHNYNTRRLCTPPPCYFLPRRSETAPATVFSTTVGLRLPLAQGAKFLIHTKKVKKVKQSLYTPWRRLGGEEV